MTQFIKMTWMFFWRICMLSFAAGSYGVAMNLAVAAVFAAMVRFGSKKTIPFFPILRLLGRKSVFVDLVEEEVAAVDGPVAPYDGKKVVSFSSGKGVETGYEPSKLATVSIPNPNRISTMRGVPGSGLTGAANMGADNIRTGQMGESNFAKALNITTLGGYNQGYADSNTLINHVNTFWSVAMPSEDNMMKPDAKYDTDIDCIVVSGNEILLVDTKFYKSGDVTYKAYGNTIYCEDNATGNLVGKPHRMTNNMKMAKERFKKHFPNMTVNAIVVLMPTDSGSPKVDGVYWPGNIKAMDITSAINTVTAKARNKGESSALHKIAMLVKN